MSNKNVNLQSIIVLIIVLIPINSPIVLSYNDKRDMFNYFPTLFACDQILFFHVSIAALSVNGRFVISKYIYIYTLS